MNTLGPGFHFSSISSFLFFLQFLSMFNLLTERFKPLINIQWVKWILVQRTCVLNSIKVGVRHMPWCCGYKGNKLLINTVITS
jgi:hypothetical protein